MARITFEHYPQDGEVFALDAFEKQVGTTVPFRMEGFEPVQAVLVAAAVSHDGKYAIITLEVPEFTPTTVLVREEDWKP